MEGKRGRERESRGGRAVVVAQRRSKKEEYRHHPPATSSRCSVEVAGQRGRVGEGQAQTAKGKERKRRSGRPPRFSKPCAVASGDAGHPRKHDRKGQTRWPTERRAQVTTVPSPLSLTFSSPPLVPHSSCSRIGVRSARRIRTYRIYPSHLQAYASKTSHASRTRRCRMRIHIYIYTHTHTYTLDISGNVFS